MIVKTLFVLLPLVGVGIAYLTRPLGEEEIVSGATGGERRLSHMALWCAYGVELVVLVAVAGLARALLDAGPPRPLGARGPRRGRAADAPALRRSARDSRWSRRSSRARSSSSWRRSSSRRPRSRSSTAGRRRASPPRGPSRRSSSAPPAPRGSPRATRPAASGGASASSSCPLLLVSEGLEAARTIRHDLLVHRTGARALADQVAPALLPLPPRAVTFRAPEPDALAFRLFRTGITWADRPTVETDRRGGAARDDGRLGVPRGRDGRRRGAGPGGARLARGERARGDGAGRRARGAKDGSPRLRRGPSLIIDGP